MAREGSKALIIVLVVLGAIVMCGALAVAAGIALYLPVRQQIELVAEESGPGGDPAEMDAELTIRDEVELVAAAIDDADADWRAHITGIEVVTRLRRPVILLQSDIGPDQATLANEVADAVTALCDGVTTPGGTACTYWFALLSAEGDSLGRRGSTDERWRLDAPASPVDAAGLYEWLDEVYGSRSDAPESWFSRIVGIADEEGSPQGYLVVRTDLDPASGEDVRAAETIINAIDSSGATFAPGVRVLFATPDWEWTSGLTGTDPYAP